MTASMKMNQNFLPTNFSLAKAKPHIMENMTARKVFTTTTMTVFLKYWGRSIILAAAL